MWGDTDVTPGGDRENELIAMYWNTIVRPQETVVKQFLHHSDSAIELLAPLLERKDNLLLQEHMAVISPSWHLHQNSVFDDLVVRQREAKKQIRREFEET